jgi:hypothetical protein
MDEAFRCAGTPVIDAIVRAELQLYGQQDRIQLNEVVHFGEHLSHPLPTWPVSVDRRILFEIFPRKWRERLTNFGNPENPSVEPQVFHFPYSTLRLL